MREEMIAAIEGNPKPGSWAGILISKYPEWIDRIEGEIGSIRKLRGVCPKCQEFRTLTKNKRLKKWRCPKCKKYYAEEEITNETIRFVFSNRNNHALGERAVFYCLFCKKVTVFRRQGELYQCSQCDGLVTERAAKALAWNFGWIIDFT